MKLFKVSDKGELESLKKLDFSDNEVFIVDDETTIYFWVGSEVPLNKKDNAVKKIRSLNKQRGRSAKLLLMEQDREYGAFAAMMDMLKEGLKEDETIERRPEFKLEETAEEIEDVIDKQIPVDSSKEDESVKRLGGWLEQQIQYRKAVSPMEEGLISDSEKADIEDQESDFDSMVRVSAYFISQNDLSYDELCWFLAERVLVIQKGYNNVSQQDIRMKAEDVFNSRSTYDELCWLIAELDIMVELGHLVIE